MRSILLTLSLCYATVQTLALPTRQQAKVSYKRLIVFGDSFSDNGSGAWVVSNMTWPADPAYYKHSFSNGPVWAETLAATLRAELLDYATGGATADNSFITGFTGSESEIEVPSAYDQVQHFLSESQPREGDLFVHWIGANDALFDTNVTGASITSLINQDIDILFRAGAKTILLGNYPPVDQFPATFGVTDYDFADVYAESLNTGLRNIVAGYSAYIDIGLTDVQALFTSIFADPAAYGIDAQYLDPPTACLKGAYASEGVPRSLCDDPERHLFFDSYHPVTQVHSRIAGLFEAVLERL